MLNIPNNNRNQVRENSVIKMDSVDSCMRSMEELLKKLSAKVNELPDLDGKNPSESEFAEDRYAEKEEMVDKVNEALDELHRYKEIVDREIERCKKNLDIIETDARSLNIDEAKEKYGFAKLSQEFEYKKSVCLARELSDLIFYSKKTLEVAGSKKFPGGKPEKKFKPPPEVLENLDSKDRIGHKGLQPVSPHAPSPFSNKEIDSLLSLGPLGGMYNR